MVYTFTHNFLVVLMLQMHRTGTQPVLPVREPCLAADWPPLELRNSQNAPIHLLRRRRRKTSLQPHPLHLRGASTRTRNSSAHLNASPIPNLVQGRWCFRNQRAKKVRCSQTFPMLFYFTLTNVYAIQTKHLSTPFSFSLALIQNQIGSQRI